MIENRIKEYIGRLTEAYPGITSVWLFGSRANGTARPESDWDFFVFGDSVTLNRLKEDRRFHNSDIDLMVVWSNEGDFQRPWGRNKRGNLKKWKWNKLSDTEAEYYSCKATPGKKVLDEKTLKAIKIS